MLRQSWCVILGHPVPRPWTLLATEHLYVCHATVRCSTRRRPPPPASLRPLHCPPCRPFTKYALPALAAECFELGKATLTLALALTLALTLTLAGECFKLGKAYQECIGACEQASKVHTETKDFNHAGRSLERGADAARDLKNFDVSKHPGEHCLPACGLLGVCSWLRIQC